MKPSQPDIRQIQQGMAALTVVMGLFFVMALVAAYTNRNLVFEQRTAINSFRAERAMNAADGAADWALSMLNAGRLSDQCVASTDAADPDFRSRYLTLDPVTGGYGLKSSGTGADAFFAGCVATGGDTPTLRCACPTITNKTVAVETPTGYLASAFRVDYGMESGRTVTPAGTLTLRLRGCSNSGSGDSACIGKYPSPAVDAISLVRATVGLLRALPSAPVAAITAGNSATSAAAISVANIDPSTAITVHAGGGINMAAGQFSLSAGTPGDGQLANDDKLKALVDGGRFFENMFGMSADLYKKQPATVRITCPNTGCKASDLEGANWLTGFPGRTVVVDGNLVLDTDLVSSTVGSVDTPVMLVVTGDMSWSKPMNFTGFIYARNLTVSGAAVNSTVRGAVAVAEDFNAQVSMVASYDAQVLNLIVKGFGSFIRVPGGWNRGA